MGKDTLETIADVVAAHERMCLMTPGKVNEIRTYLHGKNVACWCPLEEGRCHGDTLLKLANHAT